MGQFFTLTGLMYLIQNAFTLMSEIAFTGTTTNGSPTIGNISSFSGLTVGQFVVGLGIPSGATIVSMDTGAGTITISANATATTTTSAATHLWAFGTLTQGLTLYVHLLTGSVAAGPTITWANLTEANYDGYAPQAITYPGIVSTPDNSHIVFSGQGLTFQPTDYNVPNTITGHAWTLTLPGASGPSLVAVEPYSVPVPLGNLPDLIRFIPVLTFSTNQLNTVASPLLS